jgi:hypothetical protein
LRGKFLLAKRVFPDPAVSIFRAFWASVPGPCQGKTGKTMSC